MDHPHLQFHKHWEIGTEVAYMLGQCNSIMSFISLAAVQPEARQRLMRVSMVKGAQATTAIEGNTLTDAEIEKVRQGEEIAPSKQYQAKEVKNVLEAIRGSTKRVESRPSVR